MSEPEHQRAVLGDGFYIECNNFLFIIDIRPIVIGKGRNGALRYRWRDVYEWLESPWTWVDHLIIYDTELAV